MNPRRRWIADCRLHAAIKHHRCQGQGLTHRPGAAGCARRGGRCRRQHRLSACFAPALRPARPAADPGPGADRHSPLRQPVGPHASGCRTRHPDLGQGPGRWGADLGGASARGGVLINPAQPQRLRLMPALTLSPAEVDQALQLLGAALHAARPGAAIPARCPASRPSPPTAPSHCPRPGVTRPASSPAHWGCRRTGASP